MVMKSSYIDKLNSNNIYCRESSGFTYNFKVYDISRVVIKKRR